MSEINVDSYSIIGGESQTIHIMLNKNEKINSYKIYTSKLILTKVI